MSDAMITSLVALSTALVVALWNVGGWAALERRTIRQELEIVRSLPEGLERRGIERLAQERATLYIDRRRFVGPSPGRLRRLRTLTLATLMVLVVATLISGGIRIGATTLIELLWQVSLILLAGLLGFWLSHALRLRRAKNRMVRLQHARSHLVTWTDGHSGHEVQTGD